MPRGPSNFSNNFSKRMVAGQMERSSRRRGVTRVHKGLDDIHDEAHGHQNRPQRAPGAPSGRYLCLPTATALRGAGCGASILAGAALEMRWMRSGGRTASLVPSLSEFSLKAFTHLPSVYSVLLSCGGNIQMGP